MDVNRKNPKKKPSKIEEMTKDQIRQAILKKRECNAKSQFIVESLLEKDITAEYLLKCLPEINQTHFEDVIEERSILQLCGYPICQNALSKDDIPKQKYRISVKTNKVYDITARKKFCSNVCYKSAMHVKKQMLTSPLWFREYEEIPVFHLLPIDNTGSMGLEVDVTLIDRVKINTQKKSFICINDFAKASFNEMVPNSSDKLEQVKACPNNFVHFPNNSVKEAIKGDIGDANKSTQINNNVKEALDFSKENVCKPLDKSNNTILKVEESISNPSKDQIKTSEVKIEEDKTNKKPGKNPLNIVGEIIEKPEKKIDPIILQEPNNPNEEVNKVIIENKMNKLTKKQPAVTALTIEVEKCIAEWFTLDTMLFLFGEEKVKEMVADKGQVIKEYLNNYSKSIFYNSNAYDQYQALCRKLNLLELEDRRQDAQTLQRETKPLPDYKILQEESKKIQLKVKAFLAGELEIPEPVVEESNVAEDVENVTQLPLVDKKAQNALRRKIVCQHLNKALPDLLQSLNLESMSITSDVRLLVNTFKLKPNNIMFKPIQWNLIALIFINLLSLRDPRLAYMLKQPRTDQHMQLLLLSYNQDGCYFKRLLIWLTDIDRLLSDRDTELSM